MTSTAGYLLTVDVAHPPRSSSQVEAALQDALAKVRASSRLRGLKVVHGYGSHGKGGTTRGVVRDWAYRFRRHFRAIIPGEDYTLFDPTTQAMRQSCGQVPDSDLGASNPGITILWVK